MRNQTDILLFGSDFNRDDPDLRFAYGAVEAFWQAYERNSTWWAANLGRPVIECCILSALAVRDILHGVGCRHAEVFRSGVDLRCNREDGGWITVGGPDSPVLNHMWPAHMTVKLGKYLIDPVAGQFKRSWNDLSRSLILKAENDPGVRLGLPGGETTSVYTWASWEPDGRDHQLSYFKLTHEIHKRTRDWRTAPDADPGRRKRIVQDGIAALRQ